MKPESVAPRLAFAAGVGASRKEGGGEESGRGLRNRNPGT